MVEFLSYSFMRKAMIVGIFLAAVMPCIGTIIILKRLSLVGDALSHASLAGVAAGLLININPVLGATIACLGSSFAIEFIRKRFSNYADLSLAVVMSASVALAGVLSGFIDNSASFNSFLFGSIVAISDSELYSVLLISIFGLMTFILLYYKFFYFAFDERAARMAGISINTVDIIFIFIVALIVSVASRSVGALLVSSLFVLPVACAMQISRSFYSTVVIAVCFSEFIVITGLILSFYFGLKPGGTIVLLGVTVLIAILISKRALVLLSSSIIRG